MTTSHALTTLAALIFLVLLIHEVYNREIPGTITTTVEHRFVLEPPVELKSNTPYIISLDTGQEIIGRYVSIDRDAAVHSITIYGSEPNGKWSDESP